MSTPTLTREQYVAAIEKITNDPRLLDVARKQEKFLLSGWSDPEVGASCLVGEFLTTNGVEFTDRNVPYGYSSIGPLTDEIRWMTGFSLYSIGADADEAVRDALVKAGGASYPVCRETGTYYPYVEIVD